MNDDYDDDVIFPVPPRGREESSARLAFILLRATRSAAEDAWRIRDELLAHPTDGPALHNLAALAGIKDLDRR